MTESLSDTLLDLSGQMDIQRIAIDGISMTAATDKAYSQYLTEHFLENLHTFIQKAVLKLDNIAGQLLEEEKTSDELKKLAEKQHLDSNALEVEKVYQRGLTENHSHLMALLRVYHLGRVTGVRMERQRRKDND